MATYARDDDRLRPRNISFPTALQIIDGTEIRVEATDFLEAYRPTKDSLVCTSCHQPMNWNVGRLKTNQPDTLDSRPVRGAPFFLHKSRTLDYHLELESDLIARDLTQFLMKFGSQQGWSPELFSRSERHAGVVVLNISEIPGKNRTLHLLISPRPNKHHDMPIEDSIVITSTTGQMGDRRRLMLYDNKRNPLSAARLTDYLTSARVNRIMVSGYFSSTRNPRVEGERIFIPQQRELTEVLKEIASGQIVFVDGVNTIPWDKFPEGARFALVDREDVFYVENLLRAAHPRVDRKIIASEIAEALGLSIHHDTKTRGNGGRHVFGEADVLYVYAGDVENDRGPWREGGRKIIVNPHVKRITTAMSEDDWRDALVLFVDDTKNWEAFVRKSALLRNRYGADVITIRKVSRISRAIAESEKFIAPEKEAVREALRNRPWSFERNFERFETGGAEPVQLGFDLPSLGAHTFVS